MKLDIDTNILYRIPRFPLSAELKESWEDLKKAIKISSQDFYQQIKDVGADDISQLNIKIQFSIFKYFNRAKYRAIPFGTFASFGLGEIGNPTAHGIRLEDVQKIYAFPDWSEQTKEPFNFSKWLKSDGRIISNSSYYYIGKMMRYLYKEGSTFELTDIDNNETISAILDACRVSISLSKLRIAISALGLSKAQFFNIVEELIELQLLFTDQHRNIIGVDYFKRTAAKAYNQQIKYIIAEQPTSGGELSSSYFKYLPDLVEVLSAFIESPVENTALQDFKQQFRKKYDLRAVPLLHALDPELGIAYDHLAQPASAGAMITEFLPKEKSEVGRDSGELKSKIAEQFYSPTNGGQRVIYLDQITRTKNEKIVFPNSFSAMVSVSDDLIQLDHLGGSTFNALAGRFTLASEVLLTQCRQVAQLEGESNPGVLFFDLAYMAEGKVDNVNRRGSIYPYQLNFLNYSETEDIMQLNDLWISIQGDELVLRSLNYAKRVIPKLASAYNYSRSELPLFRLLCDLQHQGVCTNLSLSLSKLIPNQAYYPRVQYKNIIVSAAQWNLPVKDMKPFVDDEDNVRHCQKYLQKIGIKGFFKTGVADQTLCFHVNSLQDISMLLQYAKKLDKVQLEEVLLPVKNHFIDCNGKPFYGQVLLNLFHQNEIYHAIKRPLQKVSTTMADFAPGCEWLYFEIYCHPQRADELLYHNIDSVLRKHQLAIDHWFFIRYNEHGNHIRLRIKFKKFDEGMEIIHSLHMSLKNELEFGIVADLQIKTYRREIERYGQDNMERIEYHFYQDSAYIISLMEQIISEWGKYRICIQLLIEIQSRVFPDSTTFLKILKHNSDAFNDEHTLSSLDFKKANKYHQDYLLQQPEFISDTSISKATAFRNSFINVLLKSEPERREALFSDLFHMHVNRMFNLNQRTHEMMIYNFAVKDFLRHLAATKQKPSHLKIRKEKLV